MADVNISFWPTEPPQANSTYMTNYDLHLTAIKIDGTLCIIMLLICLVGLVGNGLLLWFLFKIQQNHCVVYIINLAIADTTFLVGYFIVIVVLIFAQSGTLESLTVGYVTMAVGDILKEIGFNTNIFVLVAISMERCLSVLSPMWYHGRLLKRQCIIVCVLLWALSCFVIFLENFVCDDTETCTAVNLFTSALYLLVVILIIISSVTLLIDIQKTSKQCHPLRLYIIILLTVLIFHLTVVPDMILRFLLNFKVLQSDAFEIAFYYIVFVCVPIYFCANSYVYIFVGMWRRQCFRRSIQQALESVFNEETESSIQRQELSS